MPPSFYGDSWVFAFTLFAQMMLAILVMEWVWRVAWSMWERPHPIAHPATMFRAIVLLVLVSMTLRGGPDLVLNMRYGELTPAGVVAWRETGNILDALALVPFSAAWLLDRLTGGAVLYQLERRPLPLHLFPTWVMLRRPAKIGVGVAFLAAALAFFR